MSQLSFTERLAFKEVAENKWETIHHPQRMGNAANIAYGGFALAVAAQAACLSAPPTHHLYTMMGNFLAPALTDRPLLSSTCIIRNTRTFFTCQVDVSQLMDNGEERSCLVALADFQAKEKGVVLEYSAPPKRKYTSYKELPGIDGVTKRLVEEGKVQLELANAFWKSFGLLYSFFEIRPCPEGVFAQNLNGVAKTLPTTQDGLQITEKSTAEYVRCRTPLPGPSDKMSALAFYMDGVLSFAPLSFDHKYLDSSAACSSLDFALRLFGNEIDLTQWSLREIITHAGAEGRTFSEGRLFDEGGKLVACMTQQSILRAWPEGKKEEKAKL